MHKLPRLGSSALDIRQCCPGADASVVMEELCWLARMGAHVVADSGEGETPLPPTAVSSASVAAATSGRQDPLEALSHCLLAVAGLCIDQKLQSAASPRYCLQRPLQDPICNRHGGMS